MKNSIALIGCGRIGFLLEYDPLRYKPCTHFGGATAAGLQISHACDKNIERLTKFAGISDIPEENCFTDYRKLVQNVNPSMVIIASWTETHADIGILACQNGTRIIICEKPITSNLPDAKKLIKTAQKNNVDLIINHERRYDSRYRTVKKLLDNGRIGEIKTVYASILTSGYYGNSDIEEGGGPLLHDGTHMIDIIRYLFGEIQSVEGEIERNTREKGFEDRAIAWLKTENGIDVFLEAGGNRDYFAFELDISGTEGRIIIGNGYEHIFNSRKSRLYTGFKDLKEKSFPKIKSINCFKKVYDEAKTILNGTKIDISSQGSDGYKALEAIHAVYLSSHQNRKKIELPVNPKKIDLKEIFKL